MHEAQKPDTAPRDMHLREWDNRFELDDSVYNVEWYYQNIGEAIDAMERTRDRIFVVVQFVAGSKRFQPTLVRRASIVGNTIGDAVFFGSCCGAHGICTPTAVGPSIYRVHAIGLTDAAAPRYRENHMIGDLTGRCVVIEGRGLLIHGTLQKQLDPVLVAEPHHDLYGLQTAAAPIHFIDIERVMLCPVTGYSDVV